MTRPERRDLARMFDRVADSYEDRPGYPAIVFDVLSEQCGLGVGTRVLEIGPGPGQATLPMLDRGARVTAVEPGAALARRLAARAAGRPLDVIVSRFEDADLGDELFDLAASATAFHWVDTTIGLRRCADHLRDGGWLALWWTHWGDSTRPDPFHEALVPILATKAPHLTAPELSPAAQLRELADRAAQIELLDEFDAPTEHSFLWEGKHDPAQLRAIFATYSPFIALPEPLRTDVLDDIETIVRDDLGGLATRPYRTILYTAQRLPR